MPEISTGKVLYLDSTIRTIEATVIADSDLDVKVGHIVFMDPKTGKYKAYAAGTSLIPNASGADGASTAPEGPVGLVFEPVRLSTGDTTVKVLLAGTVFTDLIREAGIDETACPDWLLFKYSSQDTQILFLDQEE